MSRIHSGGLSSKRVTFGQFVAARRREKGFSQFQLGKLIGVTDKAVSKWENDESYPRIEHCIRLATYLEVSLDDLLTKKGI